MTPITKIKQIGLLILLVLFISTPITYGKLIKWDDSTGRQDLLLLGFGELTLHNLNVDGDKDLFESANPSLEDGFSTNYRLSLFANGDAMKGLFINGAAIIDSRIDDEYRNVDPSEFRLRMSVETTEPLWDGWRFTGRGLYDPNRQWEMENLDTRLLYQPQEPSQLELLMRLESKENGYIEGGSLQSSFKNTKFTLHNRSLFGVYADLYTDYVGAEAVAGQLEGKSYRVNDEVEGGEYGVRSDGTSGPYDLDNAPVTRGSDIVKVETRDRFDETTVLDSRTLRRDIDYTVDCIIGRILLHQPVASESPTGDPIYIVITYDYQRDDDDQLYGGRAKVMPSEDITISGSILHRNIEDETSEGIDEPEDLYAGDIAIDIDENSKAYLEFANSQNADDDNDYQAFRLGIEGELFGSLKLNGNLQRIDDQFNSFTNSDLNPNKNQQRINLGGQFKIDSIQTITAGYSNYQTIDENGDYNPYDGIKEERIYRLGYRNNLTQVFNFGVRFERRDVEDTENNPKHDNNYQNRAMLDVDGKFDDLPLLGKFGYKAGYELIMFRQNLSVTNIGAEEDNNTNQLAVTLTSSPNDNAHISLTQRLAVSELLDSNYYDERQDVTLASAQYKFHKNLNTLTTFEYKRYTRPGEGLTLIQDDPLRTAWAGTFAIEYLPLEKIKAVGKAGRSETKDSVDCKQTKDFLLGQLAYFHTHHLSFHAESEYQRTPNNDYDEKTWDLGLKVNWNKDRLNEFTAGLIRRANIYPDDALVDNSTSYIVLVNGSVSFARYFFARAAIKSILLRDINDDEKTFSRIELGYDSNRWFRVSLGYERIESNNEDTNASEYTGQGLFIRLTGKM